MPLAPLTILPVAAAAPVLTYTCCRACFTPSLYGREDRREERRTRVALLPRLNLGLVAPVAFPSAQDPRSAPPTPLDVRSCPRCGLVQLAHTIPPDWRYQEYWYRSGTNEVMVAELADIVASLRERGVGLETDVVVDVGANDGTLLQAWNETSGGSPSLQPYRVAFEPSPNLYASLAPHAEQVYQTLYPSPDPQAKSVFRGRAMAITAIAMAYAVDDPKALFEEMSEWLHPDGWVVVQFQDLASVVAGRQIDYFCHEHLTAFSLGALCQLLLSTDLRVVDVENRTVNGGSLRVYIRHKAKLKGSTVRSANGKDHAAAQIEREDAVGIGVAALARDLDRVWERFRADAETILTLIAGWVAGVVQGGGAVDLYGASTKSQTLLQVCGLGEGQIRWAWERSRQKVGRTVGGTGIPIVSEAHGREHPPAGLVAGIWQFREAMIAREIEYLKAGGRMLFPLPWPEEVRMVDGVVAAERLEGMGA